MMREAMTVAVVTALPVAIWAVFAMLFAWLAQWALGGVLGHPVPFWPTFALVTIFGTKLQRKST